ncbi:SAP domain-containing protein 3 [Elsinoe australis]|uniref:SAP domain-containing protein 3 n=1 Tax=Elsinoe australis TaxID=40998 RepID=A0A4U7ANZ6_9PEZI|nr:SAP domain-containing protein 3 [Elsinoe australis]
MSAPRISQFIPLRQLATTSRQCSRQRRNLHMTGPSTFPSPVLTADRPISNLPKDLSSLRAEAKRRNLDATGSKSELISRLQASDLISHRSFSTSTPARPTPSTTETTTTRTRQFNTSRALKANNDSSTIDFAYFPNFSHQASASDLPGESDHLARVPLIRANFARSTPAPFADAEAQPVMKPVISSSSLDSVVSPMSEVTDNSAVEIDFQKVVSNVGSMAGSVVQEVEERVMSKVEDVKGQGTVGSVWKGFLDDVLGERKVVA